MANLVLVETAPASLGKEEVLINAPDFADEISASNFKASGRKVTSELHLKQIVTLIKNKYDVDGELTPALNKIAYSLFVGLPYSNNADISALICRMLTKYCPAMLDRAVEFSIKNRPAGAKIIYFNGPKTQVNVFFKHGISLVAETSKKVKKGETAEAE